MPKKLKTTSSPRIVKTNIAGAPGFSQSRRTFKSFIPHPIQNRRSIKTVIKNNPADGLTQPEVANLGGNPGVTSPGKGGYKGGVAIVHQTPQVPPGTKTNVRTVRPPSPTNKGGIRNPFNLKRRVGRGKV